MGIGAGMYDVVVKKLMFTISSPDEFLVMILVACLSIMLSPLTVILLM